MLDFSLLANLGIRPDGPAGERLEGFHRLLLKYNGQMDLTKVPEEEMTVRHYADSLLILKEDLIKPGDRLVDVGTGAGFPGLPLAILRPDIRVCLLESRKKRCDFLAEVIQELRLPHVTLLRGRAEDLARPPHREAYEFALARAVAPLNLLLELLLPFVKLGGKALCWKGPALFEEMAEGKAAASMLGGSPGPSLDLKIPGRSHFIQVFDKTGPTPKQYPRRAGIPASRPLGAQPR